MAVPAQRGRRPTARVRPPNPEHPVRRKTSWQRDETCRFACGCAHRKPHGVWPPPRMALATYSRYCNPLTLPVNGKHFFVIYLIYVFPDGPWILHSTVRGSAELAPHRATTLSTPFLDLEMNIYMTECIRRSLGGVLAPWLCSLTMRSKRVCCHERHAMSDMP